MVWGNTGVLLVNGQSWLRASHLSRTDRYSKGLESSSRSDTDRSWIGPQAGALYPSRAVGSASSSTRSCSEPVSTFLASDASLRKIEDDTSSWREASASMHKTSFSDFPTRCGFDCVPRNMVRIPQRKQSHSRAWDRRPSCRSRARLHTLDKYESSKDTRQTAVGTSYKSATSYKSVTSLERNLYSTTTQVLELKDRISSRKM